MGSPADVRAGARRRRRDGSTILVVGDVTGHDRTAAAVMGQLRNVLRGVAHALDSGPAEVLGALDRAMSDLGITTPATAVLARIEEPVGQAPGLARVLRWSNAGTPRWWPCACSTTGPGAL